MSKPTALFVEVLESRRLLAADWGPTAQLIAQDAATAHYPTVTGKGVTIALIDTGVNYNHPALGGGFGPGHKVKAGYDFIDNDADPMDSYGHGTNVAGVLAATGFDFNGAHYQGVAPDADLVALRVAKDATGITDFKVLEKALQWVETNYKTYGISICNISFGSGRYTSPYSDPTVSDDFQKLADLGILVVAASGNEGTSFFGGTGVAYPAADPSVAAAGSLNNSGQISDFSERGPLLDVLAPGESIPTTTLYNGYGAATGTSFSTPFVAGAAALVKQVDPTARGGDMLSILREAGTPISQTTTSLNVKHTDYYSKLNLDHTIAIAESRAAAADVKIGVAGLTNDLAYDKQGVLHWAYYDASAHHIVYATRATDGVWSASQIPDKTGHDVGAYLSLAIDATGKPSIAYYDATTTDLRFAHFDCVNWTTQKLDSSRSVGQFPSIAYDTNGNARISYYRKTSGDLRLFTFDGTNWTRASIDTAGNVGLSSSIAVSPGGTIGIGYADATNGDLKYASFDGTNWTTSKVDDLSGVSDISLAYNTSNEPSITYYYAVPADLKFATFENGGWQTATIARKGAVGQFSNLVIHKDGNADIVFYNRSLDRLQRLEGVLGTWTLTTIGTRRGRYASAAPNADGTVVTEASYATKSKKLLTGDLT